MSEIRTHKDGSTTIGPKDRYRDLVESLELYASLRSQNETSKEQLRAMAWFLGDRGEAEAAEAIMRYASVIEPLYYGTPMWGYFPIGGVP